MALLVLRDWRTQPFSKCPLKVKRDNFSMKVNAISDAKTLELSKSAKETGIFVKSCDCLLHLSTGLNHKDFAQILSLCPV